jgi:hypothetical protein
MSTEKMGTPQEIEYTCKVRRAVDSDTRYLTVKLAINGEKFGIDRLKTLILELFEERKGTVITKLRYKDCEGDMITITKHDSLPDVHFRALGMGGATQGMYFEYEIASGPAGKPKRTKKPMPKVRIAAGSSPTPKMNMKMVSGSHFTAIWEIANIGDAPFPSNVGVKLQDRKNIPDAKINIDSDDGVLALPVLNGLIPESKVAVEVPMILSEDAEVDEKCVAFFKLVDLDTNHFVYGTAVKLVLIATNPV